MNNQEQIVVNTTECANSVTFKFPLSLSENESSRLLTDCRRVPGVENTLQFSRYSVTIVRDRDFSDYDLVKDRVRGLIEKVLFEYFDQPSFAQ